MEREGGGERRQKEERGRREDDDENDSVNEKRGGERQILYSERRSELHCGYRNSESNDSPLIDEDNI